MLPHFQAWKFYAKGLLSELLSELKAYAKVSICSEMEYNIPSGDSEVLVSVASPHWAH